MSRLGWARSCEGTWLGQLVPIDCREILCHVTSCSAKNPEGTDGWLEGAYCLGTAGASVCLWGLVSGGKHYLVVFLLQCPLNKLCLSGPMHFLAFPVLSHVSPLWVVSEQALQDQYLLPGVKPPQSS